MFNIKSKDIVVIANGLGNQMSQYAFFLSKKSINKKSAYITYCSQHNGYELLRLFNISNNRHGFNLWYYFIFRILQFKKFPIITNFFKKIFYNLKFKIIVEPRTYKFNPNYLQPSTGVNYFVGGWHAQEYFIEQRERLLNVFKFPAITDDANLKHIKNIKAKNSVAIHVRRGDYLKDEHSFLFANIGTLSYYQKAIDYIKTNVANPCFFIFSNDMDWCKANLNFTNEVIFVNENSGANSWKDMYLMSICKHNIIANSTFSWWGAWLNTNSNKIVISPKKFVQCDEDVSNIYPKEWLKISSE